MNSDFLQYFQTLIQFERNYHNFGFISPKGNISAMKREVILFELIFNYSFFFLIENFMSILFGFSSVIN